jgi:hypothetical protein
MRKLLFCGVAAAIVAPASAQAWGYGGIARGADHAIIRFARADVGSSIAGVGDIKSSSNARAKRHADHANDRAKARASEKAGINGGVAPLGKPDKAKAHGKGGSKERQWKDGEKVNDKSKGKGKGRSDRRTSPGTAIAAEV